ncbi:MAG TPA: zf-HC2 domain-containing protein [Drouetiella sp.]|jgi:Putative zinc-finger
MSNDFNCEQLEPLLSAFHDGELSEVERTAAERHLNGCDACKNRLLEIGAVANSLKSLPRLNPKIDVAANIESLIANQPKQANRFSRPVFWGAAGIAAAAAVVVVAINLNGPSNLGDSPQTANSSIPHIGSKTQPVPQSQKLEVAHSIKNSSDLEVAQSVDNSSNTEQGSSEDQVGGSQVAATHLGRNGEPIGNAGAKKDAASESHNKTDRGEKRNTNVTQHVEIAQNPRVVPHIVDGSASGAHLDGSDPHLIARGTGGAGTIGADSNLVAVYDTEQHGVTEELGITTDEDGLYAIKL